MGSQTCTVVFMLFSGTLAWAAPEQSTSLEQQLASIKLQRDSVQKQLVSVRRGPLRSVMAHPIAVSPPDPIATPVTALEPVAPLLAPPQWDCPPMAEEEADTLIHEAAFRQSLSPSLLRSVIKQESAFRPCAVSLKGAQGLMQLMPATAEQLGVTDPFDPQKNVEGGAAFLRQLLNRYGGDLKLALGAYNAGMGRIEASGGIPNLLETQNYVSSILNDLHTTGENETPAPPPPKKDFRRVTLQLSLDPQQEIKTSVQLPIGN